MNSEPREAVNAEPPATPEPAPHDPLITGHFDVPRLEVRISESGAMPAAPMPEAGGTSDAHLAWWRSNLAYKAPEQVIGIPAPELTDIVADAIDGRAKVAELEARIAAYQEREAACCPEDVGFDEYIGALKGRIRGYEMLQEGLRAGIDAADRRRDEARAALARANEALRWLAGIGYGVGKRGGAPERGEVEEALEAAKQVLAAGAQGSAAQKPEGP